MLRSTNFRAYNKLKFTNLFIGGIAKIIDFNSKKTNDQILFMKDTITDLYKNIETDTLGGNLFKPQQSISDIYDDIKSRTDNKIFINIINKLDIDYVDETWQKADWIVVFLAGTVGVILDILITQTKILKPVDEMIKNAMGDTKITNIKAILDNLSNSFRGGGSAPIDFQDFDMFGFKALHEQHSFGHDPIRFIEGISQLLSGNFIGIDKLSNAISKLIICEKSS